MSLTEYKRKRNFKKTPEPAGVKAKPAKGRRYVIQKHAASRLHYDFRLEHDGTLKSWAIPKGPSLDPVVKSLAVQVEDHPLEYASFEGVIPQGEYGGGTVMVWDEGTWEPEEDATQGFKSGRLKFKLNGEKLHGSWALVRMGGRAGAGGKNWLLIKHRDAVAKATAKYDVLTREPRSVKTNRDLDEIAADSDAVWSSRKNGRSHKTKKASKHNGRPRQLRSKPARNGKKFRRRPDAIANLQDLEGSRRAALPKIFNPQLATLSTGVPAGEDWIHELKFDGYRILAHVDEAGKVRLITRNHNDWTARFQVVADAVAKLSVSSTILDGEVVALDAHGVSNFQKLQNSMKTGDVNSLVYYVFDLPYFNGYDLTAVSLLKRKGLLAAILSAANSANDGVVRYSDHIQGQGSDVLQQACRAAMEGIVAKRIDSAYHEFRSPDWLKVKCLKQQEFVIGGYSKPEGSRVGFGALLLGYYDKDKLVYAGRVGTGFTTQTLKQLTAELKTRKITASPFVGRLTSAERRGVTWVKPELVGEVEFTEWTSDGRLRHPSFNGLREDKPAQEVARERPKKIGHGSANVRHRHAAATSQSNNSFTTTVKSANREQKRPQAKSGDVTVAGVRLTHPDRVLYADQGITKQDLAEYYERVADWILPYVAGRPLTLVRCPEGAEGECFYQKHFTGSLPEAVRGATVEVKGKPEEYVAVDDVAGLVALVQMGVLEIHPWPAREDNLERPDQLVFDLDPGADVDWKQVIAGAHDVRERLESAGLKTFLRTSGGKGLHVVVPLSRRNTWDELKAFAKSVAEAVTRDAPDQYLATMSKAQRVGKVFIDYLRNQRGATAIASYSTRRRSGAPVATPLSWDELTARTRPDMYTIKNLPKRLEKMKHDPWADFFAIRQTITRQIQKAFD